MVSITSLLNPLDPAALAALVLAAEEGGRAAAELAPRSERVVVEVRPVEEPVVHTVSRARIPAELVRVGGSGVLEELVVLSRFRDYRIRVVSGGRTLLDAEWRDLRAVSPFISWISAFVDEETGYAVLGIGPLVFAGGIVVRAAPVGARYAYLDTVVAKLRVRQ